MMKKLNYLFFFFGLFLFSCTSEQPINEVPSSKLETPSSESDYSLEASALHYYVIQLGTEPSTDALKAFKTELTTFNDTKFSGDKLRISNIYIGNEKERVPVVIVRRFPGIEKAEAYHNDMLEHFESSEPVVFQAPISQSNYRNVLKRKELGTYIEFYQNQ